jgi:hypothetical protein
MDGARSKNQLRANVRVAAAGTMMPQIRRNVNIQLPCGTSSVSIKSIVVDRR